MMKRALIAGFLFVAVTTVQSFAQGNTAQKPDQATDPTQSFVSPLGLGTGATLSVTEKGTSVAASVERQAASAPLNFWQLGISGTANTNGQATVFSSRDADAPGFKGKFGIGRSSFIKQYAEYTESGGRFLRQAWCRDVLSAINKTLPNPASIPNGSRCDIALQSVKASFDQSPPSGEANTVATLVLTQLAKVAGTLTPQEQTSACKAFKAQATIYQFCPASGTPIKSVEDQREVYPELYNSIVHGQPDKFQWKAWASWAPTLSSTDYRASNNGVVDLATKLHWTQLLNTGLGDLAFYYGRVALGVEGGFGKTVQITTQNVCNNLISGTFTSQQCNQAMIGKPNPTSSWLSSATFEVTPIPIFGKGAALNPGFQGIFSYTAPTAGGHSSEFGIPLFFAPTAAPMKFVFGVQPTWDWKTNPKVGNKFSVTLFAGARPEINK